MTNHLLLRVSRVVAALELPIVLAMAPALLFPTPRRLLVLTGVPVVWLVARLSTGRTLPPTPLNATLWVLLTMTGVSVYTTFDIRSSLGKISGVLLGVLLYWAVTRWVTTASRLRAAAAAFVVAGAGLAVVGLLGTNWMSKFPALAPTIALLPKLIRGLPGAEEGFQPNAVAGCLLLFVPLQVALLFSGWRPWLPPNAQTRRTILWFVAGESVLLALTAGTLVMTQSRGAFVGLAAAAGAFLLWHSRRTRAMAVVGAGTLVVLAITLGANRLAALAISQSGPGMAGNISGRVDLWSSALDGIRDFPFTGMGMNAFRKVMPVLYPTPQSSPDFDVAHAHNHLLQAALDLGIPGLVAYSAIWLAASALLVAVYRSCRDRTYRSMAGGLGAGLIAHFTFGMTDAIPLGAKVGVLFWLTLALVVGLHRICCGPQSRDSMSHSFARR